MKKRNLAYQMNSAIENSFRLCVDKHAAKHTGERLELIYSFNEKKSLQQVVYEFRDFIKTNDTSIRLVKDLEAKHWQAFIDSKAKTCSTATLKNYVSRIRKIEIVCQKKFKFESHWGDEIIAPQSMKTTNNEKERVQQMDCKDLKAILDYGYQNSQSQAVVALDLSYRFALRASEVTSLRKSDVDADNRSLRVKGKGGRIRVIPIRDADVILLKQLIAINTNHSKLITIKTASVNQQLYRIMKHLGIKEKYPLTSIHAIRKLRAQELWDECRNNGMSKKETLNFVSEYLGHGKERYDILHIYVSNPH